MQMQGTLHAALHTVSLSAAWPPCSLALQCARAIAYTTWLTQTAIAFAYDPTIEVAVLADVPWIDCLTTECQDLFRQTGPACLSACKFCLPACLPLLCFSHPFPSVPL